MRRDDADLFAVRRSEADVRLPRAERGIGQETWWIGQSKGGASWEYLKVSFSQDHDAYQRFNEQRSTKWARGCIGAVSRTECLPGC